VWLDEVGEKRRLDGHFLCRKKVSFKVKGKFNKTVVKPVLMYGTDG